MKLRLLALLCLLCPLASAQGRATFTISQKTTLSAATEVVTIHLPSSASARTVQFDQFDGIAVSCSVACEFTFERDGTAPTATEISVNKLSADDATVLVKAYRSSNVGAGTTLWRYVMYGAGTMPIGMSDKGLKPGENITIRLAAAITGDFHVNVKGKQY